VDVTFICCTRTLVLWYHNHEKLPKNAKQGVTYVGYSELTIYNAQLHNAGKYVCRGFLLKKLILEEIGVLKVTSIHYYSN